MISESVHISINSEKNTKSETNVHFSAFFNDFIYKNVLSCATLNEMGITKNKNLQHAKLLTWKQEKKKHHNKNFTIHNK